MEERNSGDGSLCLVSGSLWRARGNHTAAGRIDPFISLVYVAPKGMKTLLEVFKALQTLWRQCNRKRKWTWSTLFFTPGVAQVVKYGCTVLCVYEPNTTQEEGWRRKSWCEVFPRMGARSIRRASKKGIINGERGSYGSGDVSRNMLVVSTVSLSTVRVPPKTKFWALLDETFALWFHPSPLLYLLSFLFY